MISIIIPCYNAQATIERALRSCLAQKDVREIILVDDGSTDSTRILLDEYAAAYPQIRAYVMPQNSGAAMARNWGVLHSHAPYLAFLDADDEYLSRAFEFSLDALKSIDYLAAIKLPCAFIDWPEDVAWHEKYAENCDILMNTFAGNLLIRREAFMALGMFPDAPIFRTNGGEDGAFMKAMIEHFTVGQVLREAPAVNVYYHAGSHGYQFFKIQQGDLPMNWNGDASEVFDVSHRHVEQVRQSLHSLKVLQSGEANKKGFHPIWRIAAKADS